MNSRTLGRIGGRRQRGGALSLLLVLLIIGLVAYFALRANTTAQGSGSQQQLVSCERVMSDLVKRTGGIGPDYKAGYDAAPEQCRKLLPPPAAITPAVPEQGQ